MQGLTDFAVALYQQADVAPACLQLQNEQDCLVPVLLAYCWHACTMGTLPEKTASTWMEHARERSTQAIAPLRQTRTWMKYHWPEAGDVREAIKQSELQLELRLLDELEALALTSTSSQYEHRQEGDLAKHLDEVLALFSEHYRINLTGDIQCLLTASSQRIAGRD